MTDAAASPSEPPPPPRRREPFFNIPGVVAACCLVLLGLYALYAFASLETQDWVLARFAFVPARMAIALDVAHRALQVSVQRVPQDDFVALIGSGGGRWWTLVTYALLHGSWAHVGFNCIWLAAFGAPVARRFGTPRFLALLVVATVVGALTQFAADMASFMPVIGASAGVSGAVGAAMRFVFRRASDPAAMFDPARREAAWRQPALSLAETFANRTGLFFIAIWFATNLLFGLYPALSGVTEGPIAWQAHIGGFLSGLLLFKLFDPRRPAPEDDGTLDLQPDVGDDSAHRPSF